MRFLNQVLREYSDSYDNGISIEQRADKIAVVYEDGQLKDAVKAADALREQGKIAFIIHQA